MLIFDQCCQMCSSTFNSASLKKKVSYKGVAKLRSRKKKREISKQVNVSKTQLQKELTVPTPLTGETACINPSIFECVIFPKLTTESKAISYSKKRERVWMKEGKKTKNQHGCASEKSTGWPPTQMCCKLMIWFHPQEPPMVVPDWNAAACTLQRCQHACLHSHPENQIWLRPAK